MSDQIIQELKNIQSVVKVLITETKTLESSFERLRSVEQLLERVAGSNERIEKMMEQSWKAYSAIKDGAATQQINKKKVND